MTDLAEALLDLRAKVLTRIAARRQLPADERMVRSVAGGMTDTEILTLLVRKNRPWGRIWGWFNRQA